MDFNEWAKNQNKDASRDSHKKSGSDKEQKKGGYQNNYNNRNKQSYGSSSGQNSNNGKYVGAPYNFVSFSQKVYSYKDEDLHAHNEVSENLHSGEITYQITAKTPIFVDDGTEHFYKNANGHYAIPGSTIRGLIRNNVQILGLSSFWDDIDDYAIMYRNVANGKERDRYKDVLGSKPIQVQGKNKMTSVSVLTNVKAGYIRQEKGRFIIYQTCVDHIKKEYKDMNYYVLSERRVVDDYLNSGKSSYPVFVKNGKSCMQHNLKPFREVIKNGCTHYIGEKNNDYKPFHIPVSYEITGEKNVTKVGTPGQFAREGYAVSTGKMNEKKAIYIIPAIDETKEIIPVPESDVAAFRIDMKKKENTLKNFGGKEHFDLPKEEETKPVFYILLEGRLYLGFTPRLRLFYDHTIKYGLKAAHKEGIMDYSKAIFGYASKEKSYKSRVSFTDAVVELPSSKATEHSVVLAEPKPSSYMDYLKGSEMNKPVTYNQDDFELRGVKQYWLHQEELKETTGNGNKKTESTLRPLAKGTVFTGKIRFHNLTDEELGLLIWSVRLNKKSWMNVGKAKSYGYGNIQLQIQKALEVNLQKAYDLSELNLDPYEPVDQDAMEKTYKTQLKEFLKDNLKGKEVEEFNPIKEFFAMKDPERMPDPTKIHYMDINSGDYQSRTGMLPKVMQLVKKK